MQEDFESKAIRNDWEEIKAKELKWYLCKDHLPNEIFKDSLILPQYFLCLTEENLVLPLQFSERIRWGKKAYNWLWFNKPAPWKVIAWAPLLK